MPAPRSAPRARVLHPIELIAIVPTYDYQCRSCGAITEVIHSMLEEGPTSCNRCGGALRRVLYPTGIIFKGSGFYRTDSRATSKSDTDGGSGGTDASSGSGSSASPPADGASAAKSGGSEPQAG
jgi:putative FmdB family regulatory protein